MTRLLVKVKLGAMIGLRVASDLLINTVPLITSIILIGSLFRCWFQSGSTPRSQRVCAVLRPSAPPFGGMAATRTHSRQHPYIFFKNICLFSGVGVDWPESATTTTLLFIAISPTGSVVSPCAPFGGTIANHHHHYIHRSSEDRCGNGDYDGVVVIVGCGGGGDMLLSNLQRNNRFTG